MEPLIRAANLLDQKGISFRIFTHPGLPVSLEEAALQRGQILEQVVRSILFRTSKDNFLMGLIAGSSRLSWRKIRSHLGISRISLAADEEVLRVTGYPVGTVNPIGLPSDLPILIDSSVLKHEVISLGSGIAGTAIIIESTSLLKALSNFAIGNFSI